MTTENNRVHTLMVGGLFMIVMGLTLGMIWQGLRADRSVEVASTHLPASQTVPAPSDGVRLVIALSAGPEKLAEVTPDGRFWYKGRWHEDRDHAVPDLMEAFRQANEWAQANQPEGGAK